MRFSTLSAVLVLASSAIAMPSWPYGRPLVPRGITLDSLASQMPTSTLPAPKGLVLKFVGLGVGTQNYTCPGNDDTAVPGTTGALARLYDLGTALNADPMAKWKISTISALALNMKSQSDSKLDQYLVSQRYQTVLGEHFFTASTPTFSLDKVKADPFPLAFVSKKADMDAPNTACPGTTAEGAIKWLYLTDDGLSKGGVNTVYRLETAGGNKAATCAGQPLHWEVPYTAQYWVYGPK
ncbi:hypothetical protein K504DRAFT_110386 [Pleomassaria siparia CBS 279.74]|uniref:Malate dehydrogenase n=1 Tax=Pleomassaria siparia CBS 279.74 TaxID=1314801 RepID=A0A6G1JWT4_9PLEO|nr:hypothetical protein K504DRAFT_110386 [Pleomassaria siparia CBS 279.74]